VLVRSDTFSSIIPSMPATSIVVASDIIFITLLMTKDGLRVKYDDISLELYTTDKRLLESNSVSCLSAGVDNDAKTGVERTGLYVGVLEVAIDLPDTDTDRDVSVRKDDWDGCNASTNMISNPKTMVFKY
jgi:hypothetical protein